MMTVLGYTNAPKTEVGALFPHRSTHCLQNRVLTCLKRLLSTNLYASLCFCGCQQVTSDLVDQT